MKPRTLSLLAIFFILTISCNNNDKKDLPCGSDNPLEDIQWLKGMKEQLDQIVGPAGYQIIRYQYQGDYVFYIDPCYLCADGLQSVYNCEGTVICEFGGIDGRNTCPDFAAEASDSTMIFDAVQH